MSKPTLYYYKVLRRPDSSIFTAAGLISAKDPLPVIRAILLYKQRRDNRPYLIPGDTLLTYDGEAEGYFYDGTQFTKQDGDYRQYFRRKDPVYD